MKLPEHRGTAAGAHDLGAIHIQLAATIKRQCDGGNGMEQPGESQVSGNTLPERKCKECQNIDIPAGVLM